MTVALGFKAGRGGSLVVAVTVERGEPRLVLSTFLATAASDDRLAFEPYHVAYEMAAGAGRPSPEIAAAVEEGRRRQEVLAIQGLGDILGRLEGEGAGPVVAALLVNRAGWVTDLLRHVLADPAHPPFAEGLAVRDALRSAVARCGLDLIELDEKSLPESTGIKLCLTPVQMEARLKAIGDGVKPWRQEHRIAALAAWVAAETR